MAEKLSTAQIEAELKKLDERLWVNTFLNLRRGLFVYLKFEQCNIYCFCKFLWEGYLAEKSQQVYDGDVNLNDLSVKIRAVMDRWDGVLE